MMMMSRVVVKQNQNEEEGSDKFRKVVKTYVMFRCLIICWEVY